MGINKSIELGIGSGVNATYWIITYIAVDVLGQTATINLNGYPSKEIYISSGGAGYITQTQVIIPVESFPDPAALAILLSPAELAVISDSKFTDGTQDVQVDNS